MVFVLIRKHKQNQPFTDTAPRLPIVGFLLVWHFWS